MKMKKPQSIIVFVISLAVIALLACLAVFGVGKNHAWSAKAIKLGLDLKGGVSITYEVEDESFTATELSDTMNKLEQRVQNYSKEATVNQEGDDRITVEIPGVYDEEKIAEELGKPGSLQFITYTGEKDDSDTEEDESIKVWLTGSDVADAQGAYRTSQTTGATEYIVQLKLTEEGKQKFADATKELVGKILYIMFDGEIVSSPVVQTAITDGSAEISGMASQEEANHLASTIRIGSLSLELNQISSRVIGAKLGDDAISTSLTAGLIGLIIVMIFMIIVYRVPGVVASISLVLYTALEMLIMYAFDVTLTLPGIAGIILSIGMAVDANVIIYARIKEELAAGQTVESSIRIGFKKAMSAIVDGNVTTLIAAVILAVMGTGTVQGFAQTLAIGIVNSMITALLVSRLLVYTFYAMGCRDKKFYGVAKPRKAFDFVGKKVITFSIAGILLVIGIATLIINSSAGKGALNYSVEFQGGYSLTADFDTDYSIDDFNDKIKPVLVDIIGSNDVEGQCYSNTNEIVIKTVELSDDVRAKVQDALAAQFGAKEDSFQTMYIGSTVSDEMRSSAVTSVIIATICMLIYICIRFRDVKFGASAVIALIHDVLIVLSFYALSRISVGNTFIACMLTIVGYSINGTIVIFDRIRENMKVMTKGDELKDLVNNSITETLTRSINTTFTTFITVFMIFLLGVTSIREFTLPLIVGILAGAYSSVFLTGAMWLFMKTKLGKARK